MAKDIRDKIIAALCDMESDMDELERVLKEYGIELRDKNGDYRSTIEILKDIADYQKKESNNTDQTKDDSRLVPTKPLPENKYYGNGRCPHCGVYFTDKSTNYCGNCGQALDWSE